MLRMAKVTLKMILFVLKEKIIVLHVRHAPWFISLTSTTKREGGTVNWYSNVQLLRRSCLSWFSRIIQCKRDKLKRKSWKLLASLVFVTSPVYTKYQRLIPLSNALKKMSLVLQNSEVVDAFKQYLNSFSHAVFINRNKKTITF